jgi:hypothetical protein
MPNDVKANSDDPKIALDAIYLQYLDMSLVELPNMRITAEQSLERTTLQVPITSYVITTVSDWITRGQITNWDGYIAQLRQMGLDRLTANHQAVYDANK